MSLKTNDSQIFMLNFWYPHFYEMFLSFLEGFKRKRKLDNHKVISFVFLKFHQKTFLSQQKFQILKMAVQAFHPM